MSIVWEYMLSNQIRCKVKSNPYEIGNYIQKAFIKSVHYI